MTDIPIRISLSEKNSQKTFTSHLCQCSCLYHCHRNSLDNLWRWGSGICLFRDDLC